MTTKSMTDCYGRRLTVENGRPGIHVHASETVGPFTSEQLRTALDEVAPAGSYTRTDEGAHIGPEGETDWHGLYLSENRRAENAEKERDEARREARGWQRDALTEVQNHRIVRNELDRLRAEQRRPLTADDITDEMTERAREEFFGGNVGGPVSGPSSARRWRAALRAALTPPPTRPEGAEEIEEKVATAAREAGVLLDVFDVRKFADSLAAQHVGLTGAES